MAGRLDGNEGYSEWMEQEDTFKKEGHGVQKAIVGDEVIKETGSSS